MKTTAYLLAVLLFSTPAARAGGGITLGQAVDKALEASHGLKQAQAAREGAQTIGRQAGHMRLPALTYQSAFTNSDDPVYVFGALLRQKEFTAADFALDKLNSPSPRTNFSNSLQLQVPLYTGGKISDFSRLGEAAVSRADAAAVYARQGTAMEAAQKYLMAAFKGQLAAIASEAVSSTEKELAVADRLREKGLVLGSDYYAAQALLGSLKAAKTVFEQEALASASGLNVLMGGSEVPQIPALLGRHLYVLPPQEELERAMSGRGDVSAADFAARAAKIARDMESDSILPQIGAFASLQTDTEAFSTNPMRRMVGVGMTVPFGDFARADRVAQKEAEHRQALEGALHLRQTAAAQLAEYRRSYESAALALPLAEAARDDAARSLELFRPMFRQGRQSVLEVARAEYALMSARAAVAEQVFKLHSYYAATLLASGGLDDAAIAFISAAVSEGEGK
ncbi:MAG: TolC family protein [Elusimicrobia bacterium]|nr:TolC family protein [Elusimicrobiota bacterium]